MSAGRSGDARFNGASEAAARAMAAASRRPPPAQLRVAPASRGARLARMPLRREAVAAAAAAAQRAPPGHSRGLRASVSRAPSALSAASDEGEGQARQWARAQGRKQPARRPQRVRTLKLKTQAHPDALMQFLYGERGSPINTIMSETGCSIDYCALSPDDVDDETAAMQGRPHTMTFLISAETTEMLEEGSHRLRMLVNRIQTHVQRRMKAQNIYERQERQAVDAAEEDARAAMYAEQQAARVGPLELDVGVRDFPGQRERASSGRPQESLASEHKRRAGPSDTDRARMAQAAYPPAAHFPALARGVGGVRFARADGGESHREVMWTRPEPNIYFRMDAPAHFPRQRSRYTDVVDVEQHETKAARPAPDSVGRPIKTAGESLLAAGDDEVRPYIRRRLHVAPDQPRQGFLPPQPRHGSPYGEHVHGVRRAMKRPLRAQPLPGSGEDSFAEMPRFHGSDAAGHQHADERASLPDQSPSADAEASAAMPVRLEPLRLDEDVDENWVMASAPRRYRRPLLGYYVRTLDGYVEPVAPPSAAYYYERPQTVYDDYMEYGDGAEWISDDDEGMYAYEYPPPRGRRPIRALPDEPREQREFARPESSDRARMWSIPDNAPTRHFKRRKVSYGDVREQGYQAGSDSAADERPAVVDAPQSDEETQPAPLHEVASPGHDAAEVGEGSSARSGTPVSECEENEPCNRNGSRELPPQAGTDADAKSERFEECPVEDEAAFPQPAAAQSEPSDDPSKETEAGSPALLNGVHGPIEDVEMAPEPAPSTESVATDRREAEPCVTASANASEDLSADSAPVRNEAPDVLPPERPTTETAPEVEAVQAEAEVSDNAAARCGVMAFKVATGEATAAGAPVLVIESEAAPADHRALTASSPWHAAAPITASMTMNDRLAHSLENMNRCEADLIHVKDELAAQKETYLALQKEECHRTRLGVLFRELLDLQSRLATCDTLGLASDRYEMLTAIQTLLDSTANSAEPIVSKVEALRKGLEGIFPMQGTLEDIISRSDGSDAEAVKRHAREELSDDDACVGREPTEQELVGDTDDAMDSGAAHLHASQDDATFDETRASADDEGDEALVAKTLPVKLERFTVKQEDESAGCPPELPPFLWTFLTRSLSPDASQASYVMRVMYKRLLEEVAKSNPYYYLRRKSELRAPRGPTLCEFGCRGASATKWERKLVSQINSRMKAFDNAAYSLARSAGGRDVLNRKKLNSIIRKVHLVAMQLHALLSHLYCLKERAVCSEADAMSGALHNSLFEKRMGVYKSRLRLVFPHKQSPAAGASASSGLDPEDLVRDTFEFFPELLVCVDIWGYNYREALLERQRRRETIILTADGVPSEPRAHASGKRLDVAALLPDAFFRSVEGQALDFDSDGNGRLRCMCDELLNMVCLWNDFRWTDSLEALALERVVAFEAGVSRSIAKILGLYALHLQALWAAHIRSDPEYLRSVRLTQHNAYYTPRHQLPFPVPSSGSAADCSRLALAPGLAADAPAAARAAAAPSPHTAMAAEPAVEPESDAEEDTNGTDTAEADHEDPTSDQRVAEAYWSRKRGDGADPGQARRDSCGGLARPIEPDELARWDDSTRASHLLDGQATDALRSDLEELSAVARELLGARDGADESCDDARGPLALADRLRVVSADIVRASDKLALHAAARHARDDGLDRELPERQPERQPETQRATAAFAGATASPSSSTVSFAPSTRRSRRRRDTDEAWLPPPSLVSALSQEQEQAAPEAEAEPSGLLADGDYEDQPVRDVIEVLAAARKQLRELSAQRARSARVREKLQAQAAELARQALELVRNTAHMYT